MPGMIDKYDARPTMKSLFMLKRMYNKTKLDGSFQRFGGYGRGSGWTVPQGCLYISNFLSGAAFNKIINVDVKAALKHCQEINHKPSIDYFTKALEEGVEYISIDGNNSASYLTAFIDGEEGVVAKVPEHGDKPLSFDKLTEIVQQDILYTEKIEVVILRKITIDDMCYLFRALNTQTKLNRQEWRQARATPLAENIRDYGLKTSDFFKKFCFKGAGSCDKRVHEEMLAQLGLKIEKDYKGDLKADQLDNLYENKNDWSVSTIRCLDDVTNHAANLFEEFEEDTISRRLVKGQIQNLFEVFKILVEKKIKIDDYRKFFEWFLFVDTKYQYGSRSVLEANLEEQSFTYWTKHYLKPEYYNRLKILFECAFLKESNRLKEDGIISYKRKENERFTWKQKLQLFISQEATLRTGDKMNILDLYLGKYEADHVVSVNAGGETSIENGELLTITQNRQKGAQSNPPHFDYQK